MKEIVTHMKHLSSMAVIVIMSGLAGASTVEGNAAFTELDSMSAKAEIALPMPKLEKTTILSEAQLIDKAAAQIKKIATSPDSPFGHIEGGNCGLSAYKLTPEAANRVNKAARKGLPNLNLKPQTYRNGGVVLLAVIHSEDEPFVFLYEQDPYTGKMEDLESLDMVVLSENIGEDPELLSQVVPGAAPDTFDGDWARVLTGLFGKGKTVNIPLGPGSAKPYWWK